MWLSFGQGDVSTGIVWQLLENILKVQLVHLSPFPPFTSCCLDCGCDGWHPMLGQEDEHDSWGDGGGES